MWLRKFFLGWFFALANAVVVQGQEAGPATFSHDRGKVAFWQTNHLSGGTGGVCIAKFGFEGESLTRPLEGLALTIRVLNKSGVDLGLSKLVLTDQLGGPRAQRYAEGTLEGVHKWPGQDDGELSPLCYEGTTLVVESAIGKQAGKTVDLVRFGQLAFTEFQRVKVKVGK